MGLTVNFLDGEVVVIAEFVVPLIKRTKCTQMLRLNCCLLMATTGVILLSTFKQTSSPVDIPLLVHANYVPVSHNSILKSRSICSHPFSFLMGLDSSIG